MIRVIAIIPFLFVYAIILAVSAMLTGIIEVISKVLVFCVRSVILFLAPDFVESGLIDIKE